MLKTIKQLLVAKPYVIAVVITLWIAYLSLAHVSNSYFLPAFSNVDKIQHCIAYFVLTCSWLFAINKNNKNIKLKFFVFILIFAFGVLMEGLQMFFTNYRRGELFDVLANSSGILFAGLLFDKIFNKISAFYRNRLA